VLPKSKRAIEMNVSIIRTFILLRKIASNYQKIMDKLETLERKYEGRFKEIYKTLNYLLDPPESQKQR
jgi:hypothetical protein